MSAPNAAWHEQHAMPPRATFDQRVAWHREHAAACGCRKPPADIAAILRRDPSGEDDPAPTMGR